MRKTTTLLALVLAGAALSGPIGLALAQQAPQPAAAPRIENVNDLLAALENADKGLRGLAADIQYDRRQVLQGDQQVRRGKLWYRATEPQDGGKPVKEFAISFDSLIVRGGDAGQMMNDQEVWIFDGQWLVEKRPDRRSFTKRRIAAPGENFDPLRVGEGPLPFPIGQKAADIRARYTVELQPAGGLFAEGTPLATFVEGTHQLLLTPRPEFAGQEEFTEIRLWYRWDPSTSRLLPRMARTTSRGGDEAYVQLLNVEAFADGVGAGAIPATVFDTTAPDAAAGWDVQIIDELAREGDHGG